MFKWDNHLPFFPHDGINVEVIHLYRLLFYLCLIKCDCMEVIGRLLPLRDPLCKYAMDYQNCPSQASLMTHRHV